MRCSMRCSLCQKKLQAFEEIMSDCKCGLKYCSRHRLPESHSCAVEYKEMGKNELKGKLQVVRATKISPL